jgi:hypothetical protein
VEDKFYKWNWKVMVFKGQVISGGGGKTVVKNDLAV